jgi:hypothetical protein
MAIKSQYQVALVNNFDAKTQVSIGAGLTTSSNLICGGTSPVGIYFPSGWTTCNIALQVSQVEGDGIFYTMTDNSGVALTIPTSASQYLPLLPAFFNGVLNLRVVCDVIQVSAVVLTFQLAPIYQGLHN